VSDRWCGRPPRIMLAVLILVGSWGASPALAHRLQVFAAANGDLIEGSAYFAGGAPASGVDVLIEDASGEVLAQLSPTADGSFSYQTMAPVEHVVVARSGDGHRAEWTVRAAELAPAYAVSAADQPTTAARAGADVASAHRLGPATGQVSTSLAPAVDMTSVDSSDVDPALTAAMELAVARQLRPLREELAAARSRASLRDVLGGIGYIIGLAGLALWWRTRGAGSRADTGSAGGRRR
jgi:nickel transport protein